jgi:peptidyl-prolyl cis-trans isomerase SurA
MMLSKRKFYAGIVAGLLLLVFTGSATAEVVDRIVAVVNQDIILLSDLRNRMEPYTQRIEQQNLDQDQQREMLFKVRKQMLDRLVNEKLTDQEIKRDNIQVDNAEIDRTIERIKAANSFTDEDLRGYLKQEHMSMQQYRDKVKEQILRARLVNYEVKSRIVVTEQDIEAYYKNHPAIYGGKTRYHLRNILMRVPNDATDAQKQAIRKQMQKLRSQIEDKASFADLARTYSQSPSAAEGGDIGEFEKDTLSPQIQAALKGLKAGQTSAVLDTDQGFQLFYLQAIERSNGKPLKSVRDEIHQKLFNQIVDKKFVSWLEDLRKKSHIKIIN